MNKHQIIYTSCRRGIKGAYDGQQIYSYDEAFSNNDTNSISGLFSYRIPTLPRGVVMTDSVAETMPKSFTYRRLDDDSCAVAQNTYLGRDYMEGGRFGNHLSHVIICGEADFSGYPCEFYGSELLRSRMEKDEVRSKERPAFLPEPELIKGNNIYPKSVIKFLSHDNRMEHFKKMLAAMLSFERVQMRTVICDSTEKIIYWIAALQYALPLEIALNINFTTYEYDPSSSVSQICGVVPEGTLYKVNNSDNHYTFDFLQNIMPDIETKGNFFDFIEKSMSTSFESIQAFHEFIRSKLTYRNPNEQYYDIYSLYSLFSDGFRNQSSDTFMNAIQMLNKYALENVETELVCKLVVEKDFIISADHDYSITIIKFILNRMNDVSSMIQEAIRSLVTEKAISAFTSTSATEDNFKKIYGEIESLCKKINIVIPYELMKDINREKLLSYMRHSTEQWRWDFITDVLCDYVVVQNIPADHLSGNYQIGRLIGDIVTSRVSSDVNNGREIIARIINKFANDWNYLINMTFNLENAFSSLPASAQMINAMWKYVYQVIAKKQASNRRNIYSILLSHNRYEQLFNLFKELMTIAGNSKSASVLFQEQFEIRNEHYLQQYMSKISECYYGYLTSHKEADTAYLKKEFLILLLQRNLVFDFFDDLIVNALSSVPIGGLSKENEEFLLSLLNYYMKTQITGRMLLMTSGMIFSKVRSKSDLENVSKKIKALAGEERINLIDLESADTEKYFEWIVPYIINSCESANDLIFSYKLFEHTNSSSRDFKIACTKEALKEGNNSKGLSSILIFLEFLYNAGNTDERKKTGEILSEVNKFLQNKLETLMSEQFKSEETYMPQWKDKQEITPSSNSVWKNIGRILKGNK